MKTETYERKRFIAVRVIPGDSARLARKWEDLPETASVLVVRLKEDELDHEAECIYENACTHQELASLIGRQVQRILDEHDRMSGR